MAYVDGFLLVVPKKKLPAYVKLAKQTAKIWRDHGAIDFRECAGDDLTLPFGLPYPKLLKLKPTETAVFSWIEYKSRAHRDRVNKKAMADPRLHTLCTPQTMPFEMKRMSVGGFKVLVK